MIALCKIRNFCYPFFEYDVKQLPALPSGDMKK